MLHISGIMASILFYGTALLLLSETIISAKIFLVVISGQENTCALSSFYSNRARQSYFSLLFSYQKLNIGPDA
jgi:hypothetical protein